MDREDVIQQLKEFRAKYFGKHESRKVSLVFCYYYSMLRFLYYMEVIYGEGLSMDEIQKTQHSCLAGSHHWDF